MTMRVGPYRVHPVAALFPRMSNEELEELVLDIEERGLQEPIVVRGDELLDGRHRWWACQRARVEPRVIEWDGEGDPTAWILSRNLLRRHLSPSQRAMLAARWREGLSEAARERQREAAVETNRRRTERPQDASPNSGGSVAPEAPPRPEAAPAPAPAAPPPERPPHAGETAQEAAEHFGVGRGTVEAAARVLRDGVAELVEAVEQGEVPVTRAAELARLPAEAQREALAEAAEAETPAERRSLLRRAADKRRPLDAYYTPPEAAVACVEVLRAELREATEVWEPHVGGGSFLEALLAAGVEGVRVSDVDETAPGLALAAERGVPAETRDFLGEPEGADWIVGNPPYDQAEAHVRRALLMARVGVAFLLPLSFLASVGRRDLWHDHPPDAVYVLRPRVSFGSLVDGEVVWTTGSAPTEYGWYVWRRGRTDTRLRWLDWRGGRP